MLVYALVAGVLFGLYFSLVGIGLNLVFGVMRIVNLAHGDFLMLGAFVAFGVVALAGIDPLFAVPPAYPRERVKHKPPRRRSCSGVLTQ